MWPPLVGESQSPVGIVAATQLGPGADSRSHEGKGPIRGTVGSHFSVDGLVPIQVGVEPCDVAAGGESGILRSSFTSGKDYFSAVNELRTRWRWNRHILHPCRRAVPGVSQRGVVVQAHPIDPVLFVANDVIGKADVDVVCIAMTRERSVLVVLEIGVKGDLAKGAK